jgi:lipopolysaccharide/colanic/teichoic acid biosynthesis glycosyltransferase
MYKLRTMRHPRPGEVKPYVIEDWKTYVFSPPGERDPRLTRWGAFARKTSVDELPNLLNVLRGEMSLVGPRPELPEIVAQYPDAYHRRHDVHPGITGQAQASGRSDLTYDEIVTYDLAYVDRHSVMTDVHILWRTFAQALTGKGAR